MQTHTPHKTNQTGEFACIVHCLSLAGMIGNGGFVTAEWGSKGDRPRWAPCSGHESLHAWDVQHATDLRPHTTVSQHSHSHHQQHTLPSVFNIPLLKTYIHLSWDFESALAQSLHLSSLQEVLPRWEVGGPCLPPIWWDQPALLPPRLGDCSWSMSLLWLRQTTRLQELPSPCRQLFCWCAFERAGDSLGNL